MRAWLSPISLVCFGLVAPGCLERDAQSNEIQAQGVFVALSYSESDVTAVRFDIVGHEESCAATPILTQTIALAESGAPIDGHSFASALLVLAPGSYRVCASPLAGAAASAECEAVSAEAAVTANQTTEVDLVSQCLGDPNGGLAPVVSLNKPPRIDSVTADPATHLTVCETLELAVAASDPEGDALSYAWTVLEGSPAAHLTGNGASARFSGPAGEYALAVTVTDAHQGQTSLSFAVTVSDATCTVPAEVFDILVAKCSPCHTTNPTPSGGLSMATPELAYANLVAHGVGASACSAQVRVVPGDASASYLIAKLRGTAGICGAQMPRGRPPLPESEILTIEAWINGLPH
jgi:hypothetical protein